MERSRNSSRHGLVLTLCGLVLLCSGAAAAKRVAAPGETAVKVERVRPEKEKLGTLRFLHENRDFIRAQYDRLRERALSRRGTAEPIDPRFLDYARLLAEIQAAQDSLARAEDARARQHLLESITQLGGLEQQLDLMERLLVDQRTRLATLEDDFTGHQQTALMVVVSGYPGAAPISEITVALDDGDSVRVPLSDEQRQSLRQGGVIELCHRFVEPRQQVIAFTLRGDAWPGGNSGFVTLEPARDRLTFLRFDLSQVEAAQGGASVQASTWLHEAKPHPVDG
jgi:hypothetical protein